VANPAFIAPIALSSQTLVHEDHPLRNGAAWRRSSLLTGR